MEYKQLSWTIIRVYLFIVYDNNYSPESSGHQV